MLDPTAPKDADAVRALFDPVQSAYGTIRGAVDTIALPPALSTPLRRLVDGLAPYLETLDTLEDTVLSVISFLEGLDPENLEIRAKLDWSPPMVPWPDATHPVFSVRQAEGGGLTISVEARVSAKSEPRADVLAELRRFDLDLIAPDSLMALHFERLAFTAGSSRKPEVDVVFGGIEFLGPLSFIETLKELIPFDGFSDPPFLDVSPAGVRAGFTLELPNIAVGVFALQNISLGADCSIPFLGKHLSIGFNFCTRERPFALTVTFIGGGGFVGLRLSPEGLDLLEMSLEAGARLAIDLGIASGSIEMMVGVYLRLEGDGGSLTGYIRIRGEVDVLGLISASIELLLEMIYDFGTGKLVGRATLTIEVEVFMFSFSVSTTVERQLAGSNGDPAFAELMDVAPDATSTRWSEYCTSFAGGSSVMATEILLTALPYSVDPASPFHVSVHVSPRLSPSGTLTDFPVFEHWTQQLAAATLVVTDHTNEPFTITLTPPDDPKRWELVFPSATPVAGFVPQSFEDTPWYSYPTTTMELFAKVIHLASMAASPVDPPLPSESPLTPLITRLADQIWRDREHGRDERGRLDETRLTRYLDDTMHSVEPPSDPGLNLLTQLHRVRRFYERPESVQAQYLTTPIPGAPTPRPKPMEPDFHQRVAMLGDHPNLLRELGLVVDVTVAEFDRLAAGAG
ncbi:MAG: hypothetical protein WKF58_15005 [Ilumatobacteraceae bacterium]